MGGGTGPSRSRGGVTSCCSWFIFEEKDVYALCASEAYFFFAHP